MDAIYWLIMLVAFLVVEIATLGLVTIWFAGGALVAFILALAGVDNLVIQAAVFAGISIVLLIATRPLAKRWINKNMTKTNVDEVIGKTGKVTEDINNIAATGYVTINGVEWMARTEDEKLIIVKESLVKVIRVEGIKVIVEQMKED